MCFVIHIVLPSLDSMLLITVPHCMNKYIQPTLFVNAVNREVADLSIAAYLFAVVAVVDTHAEHSV
jgi:hypothetical protein